MQIVRKTETGAVRHTHRGLDRLDIHLLRETLQGSTTLPFNVDFRRPFRIIARMLNIDEDTVRARLRRLEQIGFIRGWRVLLNPYLTGTLESVVWFDAHSSISKDDLVDQLKLIPGVFIIASFYGSFLGIMFRQEGKVMIRKTIALIQTLAKATTISHAYTPWPQCRTSLSTTDWRIVASIRCNPRKPFVAVSQETGISTRTAQRKLQEMAMQGILSPLCSINPKALDGTILANLGIGFEKQDCNEVCRNVALELDDFIWFTYQTVPESENELHYCWFSIAIPNISKASEISDKIKRRAGVRYCRLEFYEDHSILFDVIDEQLTRKLASKMVYVEGKEGGYRRTSPPLEH